MDMESYFNHLMANVNKNLDKAQEGLIKVESAVKAANKKLEGIEKSLVELENQIGGMK